MISTTTSGWSLILVLFTLLTNGIVSARSEAFLYYHEGDDGFLPKLLTHSTSDEERGGPLVAEIETSVRSGLRVAPVFTDNTASLLKDDDGAYAVASGNPSSGIAAKGAELKQYKAKKGDTIAAIAKKFNISEDTIRFANGNIKKVKSGQVLTILPFSGVLYDIQEGDTVESIVAKFGIESGALKRANPDYLEKILSGKGRFVIPNGKPIAASSKNTTTGKLPELKNYFALPLAGLNYGDTHPNNAVDIVAKCDVPVKASAGGTVIEDSSLKSDGSKGWNDGYGLFVLLEHENGVKTRYAHLNKTLVKVGDTVTQGDEIGLVGKTGNTDGPTGCHLHFEVLGAKNPFATK